MRRTEIESDESISGFGFRGLNTGEFFELLGPNFGLRDGAEIFTVRMNVLTEVTEISRQIYSVLDFLGDVGGLKDSLILIGGLIMHAWSLIVGNPLNNFLLGSLFEVQKVNKK